MRLWFFKDEVNIASTEELKYSKRYNIELTNSPNLKEITNVISRF